MTPTNRLRFIEREVSIPIGHQFSELRKVRILQQWYEDDPREIWTMDGEIEQVIRGEGEWRDVPLEIEE